MPLLYWTAEEEVVLIYLAALDSFHILPVEAKHVSPDVLFAVIRKQDKL